MADTRQMFQGFNDRTPAVYLTLRRALSRADLLGLKLAGLCRPAPPLRILFSPHADLEAAIRHGLRHTAHTADFAPITAASIAAHDLVVPLRIDHIEALDRDGLRPLLSYNAMPIPSLASVHLCNDKWAFNRHVANAGMEWLIPPMQVRTPPFILKKRQDERGVNTYVIRDKADLARYAPLLDDPGYFTQELVRGQVEYATHMVIRHGAICCSTTLEYLFAHDMPVKGKDSYDALRVVPCEWLPEFAAVLRSVGFEGLCCVNYKLTDGKPRIIEINPRFGGSLPNFFFTFLAALSR